MLYLIALLLAVIGAWFWADLRTWRRRMDDDDGL